MACGSSYYEVHLTVEPTPIDALRERCLAHGFSAAILYHPVKGALHICTLRSQSPYDERIDQLKTSLAAAGIKPIRLKVELVVLDEKYT